MIDLHWIGKHGDTTKIRSKICIEHGRWFKYSVVTILLGYPELATAFHACLQNKPISVIIIILSTNGAGCPWMGEWWWLMHSGIRISHINCCSSVGTTRIHIIWIEMRSNDAILFWTLTISSVNVVVAHWKGTPAYRHCSSFRKESTGWNYSRGAAISSRVNYMCTLYDAWNGRTTNIKCASLESTKHGTKLNPLISFRRWCVRKT